MKMGTTGTLSDAIVTEQLETIDKMFFQVPKDTILIDPVLSDTYCMSTKAVDVVFPQMITQARNSGYLKGDLSFFTGFLNTIDGIDEDEEAQIYNELYDLYHNAKLYGTGDIYHNLRISFDVNPDSIWNIRFLDWSTGEPKLKQIMGHLSRRANESKGECMYLNSLIHEIKQQSELKDKKLAIYVISCRGWHDEHMSESSKLEKDALYSKREIVKKLGKDNINTVSLDIRKHTPYLTRSIDTYKPAEKELRMGGKKKQRKSKKRTTHKSRKNKRKTTRKNK
jgi:hypothetical protein